MTPVVSCLLVYYIIRANNVEKSSYHFIEGIKMPWAMCPRLGRYADASMTVHLPQQDGDLLSRLAFPLNRSSQYFAQ